MTQGSEALTELPEDLVLTDLPKDLFFFFPRGGLEAPVSHFPENSMTF